MLRLLIDKHEKTVIQQIEESTSKQKEQVEQYEKRLRSEQQNLNVQRALFETLKSTGNNTKLLQFKQQFTDYSSRTFENLSALELPTPATCHIEGLNQFEELKENILQYGCFVEHQNLPQKKDNVDIEAKSDLYLGYQVLDADQMNILIDGLQNNKVRQLYTFFM